MKRFLKILLRSTLILVILLVGIFICLQFSSVQTYLGKQAGKYLSKELGTEVSVNSVDIDLWDFIHLKEVLLRDELQDTLIYVKDLNTGMFSLDLDKKLIELNSISLLEPQFNLEIHDGDSLHNLHFITDKFKKDAKDSDEFWTINAQNLKLKNGLFSYKDRNYSDSLIDVFNSRYISTKNINGILSNFSLIDDSISITTSNLSFREQCGFEVENLSSKIEISSRTISLRNSTIKTNDSFISGDLVLDTDSYKDYSDYIHKVQHDIRLDSSTVIDLKELSFFNPNKAFNSFPVLLSGDITGRIDRLKGKNLMANLGAASHFKGDLSLRGLPDLENTFIDLRIEELTSNKREIQNTLIPEFTAEKIKLPENLTELGQITYEGDFTGFINDFVTYGTFYTRIGDLKTDISFKEIDSSRKYRYSGDLITEGFDLAQLYSNPNLGSISSEIEITGEGVTRNLAELTLKGKVNSINFGKYDFENIRVNGELQENFFSGTLLSQDADAQLDFSGDIDLRESIPTYSFVSNIQNLSVQKYLPNDENIKNMSSKLTIEGRGSNLDNMEGEICLENTSFQLLDETIELQSIFLHSSLNPERVILLESDVLNAELKGTFNTNQFINTGKEIVHEFTNKITPDSELKRGLFTLKAELKDLSPLSSLLNQDLAAADGTAIQVKQDKNTTTFSIYSDSLRFEDYKLTDLILDYSNKYEFVTLDIEASDFYFGDTFHIIEPELLSFTDGPIKNSAFSWDNGEENSSGTVSFEYSVQEKDHIIAFDQSTINVGPVSWNISPEGSFSSDFNSVSFNNLLAANGEEQIFIQGNLSDREKTEVVLENIDASTINYFTPKGTTQVTGKLDGQLLIDNNFASGKTSSRLSLKSLTLDSIAVGDISSEGTWDNNEKAFELDGSLTTENRIPLAFNGKYYPFQKENNLDFLITADELQLDFLSALVKSAVSGFGGALSGEVEVKGKPAEPLLNGELYFNNAEVKIDYLNTTYILKDGIGVRPDMFILENTRIIDQEGNQGNIIGSVIHTNFRKWSYDIFLDIENQPFLCLNTNEDMNELFYGKAYGKGFIGIFGYDDYLEINANASTEKGTIINMPLGDDENVVFEDFVSFTATKADSTATALEMLQSEFDLYIDLEIDVTEDALFQMVFDQVTGDILKGSGKGHLSLIVDNESDFNMYGNIEVVKGDYLFTLQNLINKEFEIKPGGSISWYGDPFLADINLETVYKLTAPLYDLLGSAEEAYKKRIPVELVMNLDGKLLNPGIDFDINLPTSDELTKSRVNSIINSEQEKNKQAFSLLVLKKFLPSANLTNTSSSQSGLAENSSEFLSSQLNNWLSQITDEVDIGLNYRPGDEISSQEIALALSTQLFSDRLYVSGNLGVTRGNEQNHNPNTLIGDVRLEYLLREDGKIRLLVYNETNNFDINTTNNETNSTQGVGVIYTEEFDSWDEFVVEFKSLLSRKNASKDSN
ncbi:MAG: translocation/assembly module TamB domain-containing protein [Flavobacteriales bacterium]